MYNMIIFLFTMDTLIYSFFYACTDIYALNLLSYLYTLNIAIAGFLEKQLSFMYFISRFKINSSYFVT